MFKIHFWITGAWYPYSQYKPWATGTGSLHCQRLHTLHPRQRGLRLRRCTRRLAGNGGSQEFRVFDSWCTKIVEARRSGFIPWSRCYFRKLERNLPVTEDNEWHVDLERRCGKGERVLDREIHWSGERNMWKVKIPRHPQKKKIAAAFLCWFFLSSY